MRKGNIFSKILKYIFLTLLMFLLGFIGSFGLELYVKKTIGENIVTDIYIGQQKRLDEYELNFDKITVGDYKWVIDNEKIIQINGEYIDAVGIGTTKVDVYDGLGSLVKSFNITVDFAVAEVEDIIRNSLGLESYDDLYSEQILQVETINFENVQFTTLSDLYLLKNVKELSLNGTNVIGVANEYVSETVLNLSEFPKLEKLNLSNTQVSDITPFYVHEGIKDLNLENTKVASVDYKSLAKSIEILNISGTLIDKIETFEDLGLKELHANNLKLKRISLGGNHESLEKLSLNNISSASVELCGELGKIASLELNNIIVSGAVTFSTNMDNLKKLSFANSIIGSLNLLSDMSSLTDINTSGSTIDSIKFDAMFAAFKSISIEDCSVNNVMFTSNCFFPELNKLTISGIGAKSIQLSAANVGNLSSIDLSKNNLSAFEMNINSDKIVTLDLSYNKLTKIELNKDYEKLTTLNLTGNDQLNIALCGNFNCLSNIELGEGNINDMTLEGSFDSLTAIKSNGSVLKSLNLLTESSFSSLKEINLASASLISLKLGASLDGLETLILSDNSFNEINLSSVYPKLKTINLDNVILTEAMSLTGEFPKLTFVSAKNMKCASINISGTLPLLDELILSEINSSSLRINGNNIAIIKLDLSNILVNSVKLSDLNNLKNIYFKESRIDIIEFDKSFNELCEINMKEATNIKTVNFNATASLHNLITLDLSEINADVISINCDFPNLSTCNISSNNLKTFNLTNDYNSLTNLILSNNPFVNVSINNDYSKLQSIDLKECGKIENITISGIYDTLSAIYLSNTNVDKFVLDCQLQSFVEFNLSGAKINQLDFSKNSKLDKLITLNLSNLGLTTLNMEGSFNLLNKLYLDNNYFAEFNLNKAFETLNLISLNNNQYLQTLNILSDLPELETVTVENCTVLNNISIQGNADKLSELKMLNANINTLCLYGSLKNLKNIVQESGMLNNIYFGTESAINLSTISIAGVEFQYEKMQMPMPFNYSIPKNKTEILEHSLNSTTNYIMNLSSLDKLDLNDMIKISPNASCVGYYCDGANYSNVGFEFVNGASCDLYIYNLEFTAMTGKHGINATNVTTANIYFTGICKINAFNSATAKPLSTIYGNNIYINSATNLVVTSQSNSSDKKDEMNGVSAIKSTNLTLEGNFDLYGSNGGNAAGSGVKGGAGGAAIDVASKLAFTKATVSLTGGNGGRGGNNTSTAGTGGTGGSGGSAFITKNLELIESNITCNGGNGGAGGTGGNGSNGGKGLNGYEDDDGAGVNGKKGNDGGPGGTGGTGGSTICLIISGSISSNQGKIILNCGTGGAGGTGGKGGTGGAGGNGYNDDPDWDFIFEAGEDDGSGGNGGTGGKGGTGGAGGISSVDSKNGSIVNNNSSIFVINFKGETGQGGTGGKGGTGGNGGNGYEGSNSGGSAGSGGTGGTGGYPNGSKGASGDSGQKGPGQD